MINQDITEEEKWIKENIKSFDNDFKIEIPIIDVCLLLRNNPKTFVKGKKTIFKTTLQQSINKLTKSISNCQVQ